MADNRERIRELDSQIRDKIGEIRTAKEKVRAAQNKIDTAEADLRRAEHAEGTIDGPTMWHSLDSATCRYNVRAAKAEKGEAEDVVYQLENQEENLRYERNNLR